jgi:hypothetical protein
MPPTAAVPQVAACAPADAAAIADASKIFLYIVNFLNLFHEM